MTATASFVAGVHYYEVTVDASESSSTDSVIVSYMWDWGDGSAVETTNNPIFMHTFPGIATYNVTLTVTDGYGATASVTNAVWVGIIENQFRYALELLTPPYSMPLNPGPVHDHDSVYVYRILPLPIEIHLTFRTTPVAGGVSYVEAYDADNARFLLAEKTAIGDDTTFVIYWDGRGVFEPRVWANSFVTAIEFDFTLPPEEVIPDVPVGLPSAGPVVLALGASLGAAGFYMGRKR